MWSNSQQTADLVTFMGEIFDEEQFLSSVTDTKVTTSHW